MPHASSYILRCELSECKKATQSVSYGSMRILDLLPVTDPTSVNLGDIEPLRIWLNYRLIK
jgi:hypothetical protein